MGAGVGGLSTAHKLARKGHEVHIFERNPEVGGVARSMYRKNGEHSEYCWHVFMKGYTSLIPILQEIPFRGATVADQLKAITQYCYGREGDHYLIEHGSSFMGSHSVSALNVQGRKLGYSFSLGDMWKLTLLYFFVNSSHPKRFENYDNLLWSDFMASLSTDVKKLVIDSVGCYLGMQPNCVNSHAMLHLLRKGSIVPSFSDKHRLKDGRIPLCYSLNGPTNEHWLEPWTQLLSDKGVQIHLNTGIKEIRCEGGEVKEIVLSDERGDRNLQYDYYVNSLDVLSFGNLLQGADSLKTKMLELSRRSYQVQTQVILRLREKVHFGEPTIVMLTDTPWFIMYRPEAPLWDIPLGKGKEVSGELLSVGIGVWHKKGILYDKPAVECTEQEIINEVWEQMRTSSGHMKLFKTDTGKTMYDVVYSSYDVWHSFSYDPKQGRMDTWEPKFSNNVGTVALRPTTYDPVLTNLVHANAYTRTDNNLYNMDSAAEAGVRAANLIMYKEARADWEKYMPPKKFWTFCQMIDKILLDNGNPNPIEGLLKRKPATGGPVGNVFSY